MTFLNVHQLERQGADIQSKVEELVKNQSMRDRDKLKDDAIAHLSDQLIALTATLDSIAITHQGCFSGRRIEYASSIGKPFVS